MIFHAAYSSSILEVIKDVTNGIRPLLDPFAGPGGIHAIGGATIGVEIEPEWSAMHPRNIVGDALHLPFANDTFPIVATSPTYGNRLADHHNAKDKSYRMSYTHDLRRLTNDNKRQLHNHNTGYYKWSAKYRNLHRGAYREVIRVLKPNGIFVLNVSDHISKFEVVKVSQWHLDICLAFGFKLAEHFKIETPRLRMGTNSELRVPYENLYVFEARE